MIDLGLFADLDPLLGATFRFAALCGYHLRRGLSCFNVALLVLVVHRFPGKVR